MIAKQSKGELHRARQRRATLYCKGYLTASTQNILWVCNVFCCHMVVTNNADIVSMAVVLTIVMEVI